MFWGTDPLKLIDACHNPQSCENFVSALDESIRA